MPNIKNIIFDLGGVLLNIDYNKTTRAFETLGVEQFDEMFSQLKANALFAQLETGQIREPEFYAAIRSVIPRPVTDEQIRDAWNAMMLDFRAGSLSFLEALSQRYRLFLLSNTNSIHLQAFAGIFTRDTGKAALDVYFEKAWYSHIIGYRKPDAAVYRFALEDAAILPGETIFIDDTVINTQAAAELGIHTHLLLPQERIEGLGLM